MKVLLVATVQSHICQFHKPLVQMLHDHGCEVHVAARNNLAEKNGLKLDFVDKIYDIAFERSPFNKRNLAAFKELKEVILQEAYDVVHTNTPVGGILGRIAAQRIRKRGGKVLYTAHGFHFFKGGPRKSWLIYYPVERFMCRFTDELITITQEDYELAKQRFPVSVSRIHGIGANTEKYQCADCEEQQTLRKKIGFSEAQRIILCTGELNANKNQIIAVQAMERVVKHIPEAVLLLAGNGETQHLLQAAIQEANLQKHVFLLGYRTDLERFVKCADLVLSCSKREGLPVNIIEGMLCGKPVVASINRGHRELVEENVTGYLVAHDNADAFAEHIIAILQDETTKLRFGAAALQKSQLYTDRSVYTELETVYYKKAVI